MTTAAWTPAVQSAADDDALARATMRRVTRRLIPFLLLLYIFNFLDRTNVGIAALQMNRDLGFSAAAYGFGAGIFFLAYAIFEVPSNVLLTRVGARFWIARIMITWGIIASAMMFVRTPVHFYVLRFLLGAAEAGFFPGIVFYLGQWFPVAMRGRAQASFMMGIPLSNTIGGLVGGWLLALDGKMHVAGWQWLFLIEGLPSVLLGISVLFVLTNKPADAHWLDPDQRDWLMARLQREDDESRTPHGLPPMRALLHGMLWMTALAYLLVNTGAYAYQFWGPTLIRDMLGTTSVQTGYVVAAIAVASAVAMIAVSTSSDRRQERFLHAAFCAMLVCVGATGVALLSVPALRVCSLALIPMGMTSFLSPYFCLPGMLFRGTALAAAIALVNSVGNLGGFIGPNVIGTLVTLTGGTQGAFLCLAAFALGAAVICALLRGHEAFVNQ